MEGAKWKRSFEVRRTLIPVMVYKTIKVVDLFQTTRAKCLLTMVVSPVTREKPLEANWQFLSPAQTISNQLWLYMQVCSAVGQPPSLRVFSQHLKVFFTFQFGSKNGSRGNQAYFHYCVLIEKPVSTQSCPKREPMEQFQTIRDFSSDYHLWSREDHVSNHWRREGVES